MKIKKINLLFLKYIKAFSNQDLEILEQMFSKRIVLKDWERNIKGKNNVLEENKKIFNSVKSIKCKIIKKFIFNYTVICVLKITINNKDIINVVDVIEFNKKKEISSIIAFKR